MAQTTLSATNVYIRGQIQGPIWMPTITCTKYFTVSKDDFRYSDGSRPTLRDMVLRATNDGDFQSADISFGTLTIELIRPRKDGTGYSTRKRNWDLRRFASIQDCIVAEDDVEYADLAN